MKTGRLIEKKTSESGDSIEIYAAADGDHGFVVGYRKLGSESLGLMGKKRFEHLGHARDYAAELANDGD